MISTYGSLTDFVLVWEPLCACACAHPPHPPALVLSFIRTGGPSVNKTDLSGCSKTSSHQSPVTLSPLTTTTTITTSWPPVRQSQSPGHSSTCTAPRQPRFRRTSHSPHFTSHPLLRIHTSASAERPLPLPAALLSSMRKH